MPIDPPTDNGVQGPRPLLVTPDELLPTLFTPIARARLWRPFSDRQRLLAANMLGVHLSDMMGVWIDKTQARVGRLSTHDRLASQSGSRLRLLSLMRPAIPSDHLLLAAANLIEFTIDRHLLLGYSLQVGDVIVESETLRKQGTESDVGLTARRLEELFDEILTSRRFLTRGRLLRLISYRLELLSLTRCPHPYELYPAEASFNDSHTAF